MTLKRETLLIINQLKIKPKKSLGQNFLIDKNVANKIILQANLTKDDVILEIGPGLGALTEILVEKVKKVYVIEIEPKFCLYLSKKLSKYNNVEIINDDILKTELPPHNKVVSNIPYSITGPILEKVFFRENSPCGVLTIEKSIADRIFYTGNYKNFSRITIGLNSFMKPIAKFKISRNCFYPAPNIDLMLIKIKPNDEINPFLLEKDNRTFFLQFVSKIMPYKNKNIANALKLFLKMEKVDILQTLQDNGFENTKVAGIKIKDFANLAKLFLAFHGD